MKKSHKIFIILSILCIGIGIGVGIYFIFFGQQSKKMESTIEQPITTTFESGIANITLPPENIANMTLPPENIANMDLSSGIANMTLPPENIANMNLSGIANMDLSGIANMDLSSNIATMNLFQTIGTTPPPKVILDANKTLLTLKNNGDGINYTLNGVYNGKDITLIDEQKIYSFFGANSEEKLYKPNVFVNFTFTDPTTKQDYKVQLRIISSSIEFDSNINSFVKFRATTDLEIPLPVLPEVYTALKFINNKAKIIYDAWSKKYNLFAFYNGISVKLVDEKHTAPEYEYKINEIVDLVFINPKSKEIETVKFKITNKADSIFFIFDAILSPPTT